MIELEETQETRAAEEYLNAPDIFYWMDATGCRFCC
jgi:hypothetical protein